MIWAELNSGVFRRIRQEEYRRAVGTHYGPTRMHRAYTATMIHGPHYEPDNGPRYELYHEPRYTLSRDLTSVFCSIEYIHFSL